MPVDGASIDVVIVTADSRDMVLRCIDELRDPAIGRLVVVDNASLDGTAEAVAVRHPSTIVVPLREPAGFASACNRGAEHGAADLILFLNSDVLAVPGAVSTLREAIAAHPQAVAAGGRLVNVDDLRTQHQYAPRDFPSLLSMSVQLVGLENLWPGNPISGRHVHRSVDEKSIVAVDQPAAACLLVRRSAFEAIGGFDERYWFWFEDCDLLRRLSDLGAALYVPTAPFRHVGGGTFRRWSPSQVVRSLHHGMLRYAEVHFSAPARVALGLFMAALSIPRIARRRRSSPDMADAFAAVLRAALTLAVGRPIPSFSHRERLQSLATASERVLSGR